MKLNHLDLQVEDPQVTAAFLEKYFGFRFLTSRTAKALVVLIGDDGFSLVIQKKRDASEKYPDGFHIGFVLESPEAVHQHFELLKSEGVNVGDSVQKNNRGTMFYFHIPGDVLVEVSSKN